MAHSSGGGSSGGGCHSGGSSGSSQNSHNSFRHSSHYFPGSSRYAYTDRNGDIQHVYLNDHPSKWKIMPSFSDILFFLVFLFVLFNFGKTCFIPTKIPNPSTEIVIEDRLHLISDQEKLRHELLQFSEETGVTPAVQTVSRDQWYGEHASLMDYALSEYYRLFDDEKHWLIVYSAATDEAGNLKPKTWSFEGIIGDDTEASINDALCEIFTQKTYDNLMAEQDPGQAVGNSFLNLMQKRNSGFLSLNKEFLVHGGILALIFGPNVYFTVAETCGKIKYKHAVLDE